MCSDTFHAWILHVVYSHGWRREIATAWSDADRALLACLDHRAQRRALHNTKHKALQSKEYVQSILIK